MCCIIVGKLCGWDKLVPIILTFVDKEAQVALQLLVDSLCLTVSLWVVRSRGTDGNPEEAVQFTGELCNKLGSAITESVLR